MGNFLAAAAEHCLFLLFFPPEESFKQPQLQMKLCVCPARALRKWNIKYPSRRSFSWQNLQELHQTCSKGEEGTRNLR